MEMAPTATRKHSAPKLADFSEVMNALFQQVNRVGTR